MRLRSLHLKNIRSYRELEVAFPDGITLLAGDIGSGKSTLLISVEFALFGLSRTELSGSALLRHGCSEGEVRLTFAVDGAEYTILRTLKRTKTGIVQDVGWIETQGQRELLTASELRARVYTLLGYPLQFLAKQRNLLYRFTLYTPQEEMKAILTQSDEERIETIRRLFGIDAYRTIRENAQLVVKALKDSEATHAEVLAHLEQDAEKLEEKLAELPQLIERRTRVAEERALATQRLAANEGTLQTLERERAQIQHELQVHAMQERSRTLATQELARLGALREQKERVHSQTMQAITELRAKREQEQALLRLPRGQLTEELAKVQLRMQELSEESGKLLAILSEHAPTVGETCPLCRQSVPHEHVASLRATLEAKQQAAQRKRERVLQELATARAQAQELTQGIERARALEELTRREAQLVAQLEQHAQERTLLDQALAAQQASLAQLPPVVARTDLDARRTAVEARFRDSHEIVQRDRTSLIESERRLAMLAQQEQSLHESQKELANVRLLHAQRTQLCNQSAAQRAWFAQRFIPFSTTVEQHVLGAVHGAFSAAFRSWCARLLEENGVMAHLDTSFAPLLQQDGYDTDASSLSGGERTAVSLAYRLALVHTIHGLLPHLGTAGLLLLDEPADGFSREQLERVGILLRELKMEQILLVSHEPELEGCVDHVLRVRRDGERSVVEG